MTVVIGTMVLCSDIIFPSLLIMKGQINKLTRGQHGIVASCYINQTTAWLGYQLLTRRRFGRMAFKDIRECIFTEKFRTKL